MHPLLHQVLIRPPRFRTGLAAGSALMPTSEKGGTGTSPVPLVSGSTGGEGGGVLFVRVETVHDLEILHVGDSAQRRLRFEACTSDISLLPPRTPAA